MIKVSVIGAGTMGAGIAQIAATNGHEVCLYDSFDGAIESAESKLKKILNRLVEKERINQEENEAILGRINFTKEIKEGFLFYLLGHERPIHELLSPNWKDQRQAMETQFAGMSVSTPPFLVPHRIRVY